MVVSSVFGVVVEVSHAPMAAEMTVAQLPEMARQMLVASSKNQEQANELKQNERSAGEVCSPNQIVEQTQGSFSLSLPENIVSHVIVYMMSTPDRSLGSFYASIFPTVATVAIQVVISVTLSQQVFGHESLTGSCGLNDPNSDGESAAWLLVLVSVCLFLGICYGDAKENTNIRHWINCFHVAEAPEELQFQKYSSQLAGRSVEYYKPASGITATQRNMFMALILVQIIIDLYVAILGSTIILLSGSSLEVVLNSVALQFVLDLDEIAYKVFVTSYWKAVLANVPPISLHGLEQGFCTERLVDSWSSRSAFAGAMLILATALVAQNACILPECDVPTCWAYTVSRSSPPSAPPPAAS